jgi:hypothetical protein
MENTERYRLHELMNLFKISYSELMEILHKSGGIELFEKRFIGKYAIKVLPAGNVKKFKSLIKDKLCRRAA